MTAGIQSKELKEGTGKLAERGTIAVIHCRAFLNRGEECLSSYRDGQPWRIPLGKRYHIAGLEKGIEGMREGGRRELIISPHLAYGAQRTGAIPPNAVLRFEVELLEVRSPEQALKAEDYPPGRQLIVFRPGEAARGLPQLQFGVHEDGRAGGFFSPPVPGGTWRHSRPQVFEFKFSAAEAAELIDSALKLPLEFPAAILHHDDLWADASEKANSITRDCRTNTLCVTVNVYERGQQLAYYALREHCPVLLGSRFYTILMNQLTELRPDLIARHTPG